MSSIQIQTWRKFPSEGGGSIVFDQDRIAVAGDERVCVWQGSSRIATVEALFPAPGMPRFAGQKLYWGPGILDLESGEYERLKNAEPTIQPGGGERPHVYAWSTGGDRLVAAFSTGNSNRPVRVTLYDGKTGARVATLREGTGLPPEAAWVGEQAVVVGFSTPEVFDHSGKPVTRIEAGANNVAAIAAPKSEQRLMVLDLNRTVTWIDISTWRVLDVWRGPWAHAAVSPDGRFVVALEAWGKLHFARMENDAFKPAGVAECDPQAVAVALSADQIGTIGGGEMSVAGLSVN